MKALLIITALALSATSNANIKQTAMVDYVYTDDAVIDYRFFQSGM